MAEIFNAMESAKHLLDLSEHAFDNNALGQLARAKFVGELADYNDKPAQLRTIVNEMQNMTTATETFGAHPRIEPQLDPCGNIETLTVFEESPNSRIVEGQTPQQSCGGDAACEKLLAEASGSIFKIYSDRFYQGTGWVGADGRLITDFHVVDGKRELIAESADGKIYKLGKDLAIDDVNDLAAVGFVGPRPENARPLPVSLETPKPGDRVSLLSHPGGDPLSLSQGTFIDAVDGLYGLQDKTRAEARLKSQLATAPQALQSDLSQFFLRQMDLSAVIGAPGSSGGPLFDKAGRVFSVLDKGSPNPTVKEIQATPAQHVNDLISQPLQSRKFQISSGYETGIQTRLQRFAREDLLHSAIDAGVPLGGSAFLARTFLKAGSVKTNLVAGLFAAGDGYYQYKSVKGSTNWRDTVAGGLGLAGDSLMATGLLPVAGSVKMALFGAGAALRLGSELVPNHYVIKDVRRTDGTTTPDVLTYVESRNKTG